MLGGGAIGIGAFAACSCATSCVCVCNACISCETWSCNALMRSSFVQCSLAAVPTLSCTALGAGTGLGCTRPDCRGTIALEDNGRPSGASTKTGGPKLMGMLGTLDIFWVDDAGCAASGKTGLN